MSTMPKTVASAKRTKRFKALLAVGMTENAALEFMGVAPTPAADPNAVNIATLVAGGFTEAEARAALGLVTADTPTAAKPLTSKEVGEQLVVEQGFGFAKGRVYVTPDTIEAAVRVRKTGRPEIIASSGVGRTAAVLVFAEDSGDVALQNLVRGESE